MFKQRRPKVRLHARNSITKLRPAVASRIQRLVSGEVVGCVTIYRLLCRKNRMKSTARQKYLSSFLKILFQAIGHSVKFTEITFQGGSSLLFTTNNLSMASPKQLLSIFLHKLILVYI